MCILLLLLENSIAKFGVEGNAAMNPQNLAGNSSEGCPPIWTELIFYSIPNSR